MDGCCFHSFTHAPVFSQFCGFFFPLKSPFGLFTRLQLSEYDFIYCLTFLPISFILCCFQCHLTSVPTFPLSFALCLPLLSLPLMLLFSLSSHIPFPTLQHESPLHYVCHPVAQTSHRLYMLYTCAHTQTHLAATSLWSLSGSVMCSTEPVPMLHPLFTPSFSSLTPYTTLALPFHFSPCFPIPAIHTIYT